MSQNTLFVSVLNNMEEQEIDRIELQKRFGDHLVKLRKSKGLTSAELARRAYMERSNIARLETGRQNPSLLILKKISIALEISIQELFQDFK